MSFDVECPYCGADQNIDHDDGQGYEEDRIHEQQCDACEKNFTFTTSVLYFYEASKADCLNGGEHKYQANCCIPRKYTKMECVDCEARRDPTPQEMEQIMSDDWRNCKTFQE